MLLWVVVACHGGSSPQGCPRRFGPACLGRRESDITSRREATTMDLRYQLGSRIRYPVVPGNSV
jgi:hypothetical protein